MNTTKQPLSPESAPSPHQEDSMKQASLLLSQIQDEVGKVLVGQSHMTQAMLVGLLTGGHILLEGLPGLAKTLAVKTLSKVLDADFKRLQFTPDLLPSDLIGTMIYNNRTQEFTAKKGPIFANIILADEINRAPAKVQSALLEAMAEKQVTIGETSFPLDSPFLVLATQNPLEQEGTYPLPEAQLDRFLFKIQVGYPTRAEERLILDRMTTETFPKTSLVFSKQEILHLGQQLNHVYLDDKIKGYILEIILATRSAEAAINEKVLHLRKHIQVGASPRATLALTQVSKASALLESRTFVSPDDVKRFAKEVLRHRLILTFEAEAQNLTTDEVIDELLESVPVP